MIKAVDGMEIPCYLTVPVGVAVKKLPLVMLIHGGPWFRDSWGFDPRRSGSPTAATLPCCR